MAEGDGGGDGSHDTDWRVVALIVAHRQQELERERLKINE